MTMQKIGEGRSEENERNIKTWLHTIVKLVTVTGGQQPQQTEISDFPLSKSKRPLLKAGAFI